MIVVKITLTGKLEAKDYKAFLPEVERLIKERGKLRMLCHLKGSHGWTIGALGVDVQFDFHRYADVAQPADVGDKRWQAGMATYCKPFTMSEVK